MIKLINTITNLNYKKLYLLIAFLFISINSNALSTAEVKVTLNLQDVALKVAMNTIEAETSLLFFYKNDDIDLDRKVSIVVENEHIEQVLSMLFEPFQINYKVKNGQVILKKSYLEVSLSNKIIGKVINKVTNEKIPYCNITFANTLMGTATNEHGEFEINIDSFPVQLEFSHLNYKKELITFEKQGEITVALEPLVNEMDEMTLNSGSKYYAIQLAKKAFRSSEITSLENKYGRAYYRQKSKNDTVFSEFSEIIYDIKYSTIGIKSWDILEGRYAIKEGKATNKNYTLLSQILKVIQPYSEDLIFPLREEVTPFYTIKVVEKIKSEEGQIIVLYFTPKKHVNRPILEGEVYINSKTNEVLKVVGTVVNDDFKVVNIRGKSTTKKNYKLTYEIAFKKDPILNMVLDHINVEHDFDYYKKDSLITHVSSTSNLTFFEHYTPTSRKKLGRQFRRSLSDWDKLNEIGYDEVFWNENPVIRRTPIENDVIKSFSKDKAFESIFLNSEGKVSFIQSDISDDPMIENLDETITNYNIYNPVEKVFLHTNKDLIATGEDLWYSSYVTLGSNHLYSMASKVLHVDLIDPNNQIILSQTQGITQGRGDGSLKIPDTLASGFYQIRAYTNWMRNYEPEFFFTKTIKLLNKEAPELESVIDEQHVDVQFFPEGGHTVEGINSRVAFKAIGVDGQGKSIKGEIVDSKGNFIAPIKSRFQGSGFFNLTPKAGENYTAILNDNSSFNLPTALNNGYSMFVNNLNQKTIQVRIQASSSLINDAFYILGHLNNEKHYHGKFNFGGKPEVSFEIPKNRFPTGLLTLTLFNKNKKPLCERVIFINNHDELVIHSTTQTNQGKDFNSTLNIEVTDTDGRPVATNLSIAILDPKKNEKSQNASNIVSHMHLESNLKGSIEAPNLLLIDNSKSTMHKMELILLTHGWRRFNWSELEEGSYTKDKEFPFSRGLQLSGMATNMYDKPLKNAQLKLNAISKDLIGNYETLTDNSGRFQIKNFENAMDTKLVFSIKNRIDKKLDLKIKLDDTIEETPPFSNFFSVPMQGISKGDNSFLTHIKSSPKKTTLNKINDSIERLNEVKIYGSNEQRIKNVSSISHNIIPDETIDPVHHTGKNLEEVLNRLPNVTYRNGFLVFRRAYRPPIYLLDGVQINDPKSYYINSQIAKIEVLKSQYKTAVYGPRGKDGVILITTKKGDSGNYGEGKYASFNIQGHSGVKEFYVPKYTTSTTKKIEFSDTLYWNALINTDENGKAKVEFTKPLNVENIQINIEALSKYGIPGSYLKTVK